MRDLNEQMAMSQNARTKFKQRLAGGAVLLIVLAIFLPFIFNHSRIAATNPVVDNHTVAVEQTPVASPVASPASSSNPVATRSASVASDSATAIAPPAQVASQNTLPAAPEQSMRSDQPGLTQRQSESVQPIQPEQQTSAQAVNPQPAQPEVAVPPAIQTTPKPLQSSQQQPAAPAATQPVQPVHTIESAPVLPLPAKVKPVHPVAHRVLPPPARTAVKTPHASWVIQVGSFSQAEYARQLTEKLRNRGLHAYMQRGSNQLVRVYIGPLATQQQAQKIQKKVQAEFQLSSLITQKNA